MTRKTLSKQEWLDHLSSQERGKATQREYCREHGLSLSAFRYWKKREAHEADSGTKKFIEIPTACKNHLAPAKGSCTIIFPNGCSLRVRVLGGRRDLLELATMVKNL